MHINRFLNEKLYNRKCASHSASESSSKHFPLLSLGHEIPFDSTRQKRASRKFSFAFAKTFLDVFV
jgi:hypothetical protein